MRHEGLHTNNSIMRSIGGMIAEFHWSHTSVVFIQLFCVIYNTYIKTIISNPQAFQTYTIYFWIQNSKCRILSPSFSI